MQIQLLNPELQRFIKQEVESGRFSSPDAAVAAAIEQMMIDASNDLMDAETVAAIEESEAQFDRGEVISAEDAFAELRRKHVK